MKEKFYFRLVLKRGWVQIQRLLLMISTIDNPLNIVNYILYRRYILILSHTLLLSSGLNGQSCVNRILKLDTNIEVLNLTVAREYCNPENASFNLCYNCTDDLLQGYNRMYPFNLRDSSVSYDTTFLLDGMREGSVVKSKEIASEINNCCWVWPPLLEERLDSISHSIPKLVVQPTRLQRKRIKKFLRFCPNRRSKKDYELAYTILSVKMLVVPLGYVNVGESSLDLRVETGYSDSVKTYAYGIICIFIE